MKLHYLITFVADMGAAVTFYRDTLGLALRFQSPEWTEFDTGSTTLALHTSSPVNPPGTMRMGFAVPDMEEFKAQLQRSGLGLTHEPRAEHGVLISEFADAAGVRYAVSAPVK